MNSEKEIEKSINPISIAIIVLSLAISIALIYFGIVHWSIAATGGTILLIFAASIRIADQWKKPLSLEWENLLD